MSEPIVWLPLQGDYKNQGLGDYEISELGTVSWVGGKLGQAMRAGTGAQVVNGLSINSNLTDILANDYSVMVWIKPNGTHVHYNGTFISSGNWNGTKWAFGISQDNQKIDLCSNGYNIWYTCPVAVGEWAHIACIRTSDGKISLYKNGEFVGSNTRTDHPQSDATNTCIGRETYASGYFSFNGDMCDLRVYDRAISQKELHDIAQGLVLHLPMDNGGLGNENLIQYSTSFKAGSNATGISSSVNENGEYVVTANSGNNNWNSSFWMSGALDNVEEAFEEGDPFTISFWIRSYDGASTTPPKIYIKSGMGYWQMHGTVSSYYSQVSYSGTWHKTNNLSPHLGWSACNGTYYIKAWKIEKGSSSTPWAPALTESNEPDLNDYPGHYNLFTGTGTNSYLSGASGTSNTATVTTGKWYGASGGNGAFSVTSDSSVPVGSYSWNILNNTSGNRDYGQQGVTYAANEEYTVTWWAKGNGTFQLRLWDYTSGSQRFAWTYALSSEWQHYTEHFKSTSTIAGHNCNLIFGVAGKANLYMCGMKVEEGTTATKYMLAESEYETPPTVEYKRHIADASGYGHDGIILRESEIVSDSPRYECATHMIDPTPTANSNTGTYARIPLHMEGHDAITFVWWGKHKAGYSGGWHGIFSTSANAAAPTDYNTTTANHRDSAFDVCNTSGTVVRAGANMFVANEWHHYALVYDGAHVLTYRDGTQVTSHALTGALKPFDYIYLNFSKAGGVFRMNDGYWSDFRVYATALSEEDIKALYRTGAAIDDGQRMHTHEYVEVDLQNLATPFYQASANGTLNDSYSVTFDLSNQRDTFVFFRNAIALEASKTYYVSFHAEGLADGDNVAFYVGGNRSKCDIVVHNGWNSAALTDLDLAVNSGMGLDDYQRSSSQHVTISDFRITTGVIPEIEKESKVRAAQFFDGPEQDASIFKSGDIAAADLVEI